MGHFSEQHQVEAYAYRADPGVPAFPDDRPIVIFDGHCVLCSRFARFILKHDHKRQIRLAAAQTPIGQALFRHLKLDPVQFETNVLLVDGKAHFKSDGSIRIFALLGWPFVLCNLLRIVPSTLLDALYDVIAHHRLRWFGAQSVCFMADATERERFLE